MSNCLNYIENLILYSIFKGLYSRRRSLKKNIKRRSCVKWNMVLFLVIKIHWLLEDWVEMRKTENKTYLLNWYFYFFSRMLINKCLPKVIDGLSSDFIFFYKFLFVFFYEQHTIYYNASILCIKIIMVYCLKSLEL